MRLLLALALASSLALKPTKKLVPVFDAKPYKKAYYERFATAKWEQRGALAAATTRESLVAPAPNEDPPAPVASWRELFASAQNTPLGYARREALRSAFFEAAEREHGRAALLGAAVIASVAWDARLAPLVLFARCGCPSALQQFAAGAPNLAVEAPLAAAGAAFLLRELRRAVLAPAVAVNEEDAATARGRALARRAELFQGRVAMLGTAAVVLLAKPLTESFNVEVAGAVADAAGVLTDAVAAVVEAAP